MMDFISKLSPTELVALQWSNNIIRYFLIAGLTYLIAWKWLFPRIKHRFLYKEVPDHKEIKREIKYSLISTFIFLLPSLSFLVAREFGYTSMHMNFSEYDLTWYLLSYVAVFFLHDTYFYWTHRLMHTKKLFPYFHRVHHLSHKPSPMAALAFHPLEAMVEVLFFLLLRIFTPIHISVIIFFTLFSLFMNVYGHLGFNLFSVERQKKFPLNVLSHSTNHSWHHQYHRGNYGFYLQFWDRLMNTWRGELKEVDHHSSVN